MSTVKITSHYHDVRLGNQRKIFKTSIGTLVSLVQLGTESTQGLCYTISTDNGATWQTPIQITTEANSSKYYSGWLDSDNNLYVVYFRNTTTEKTLFRKLTYSETDSWSVGTEYTIWTDSFSFSYLHIRKTTNGRLWAFTTRDTNNPWSKYSDNDGATWTTSDYSPNVPVHLDVVIDDNDVYVYLSAVYSSGSIIYERKFTYSTGLWTAENTLYESSTVVVNRVAVTRTSDGHRHLVYRQTNNKIYYREFTSSWQSAVEITTFGVNDASNENDLTIGAYTDDIMVVWNEYSASNQFDIKYKKRIVTTWDLSVTNLTNDSINNRCPVVPFYLDGDCNGLFLWYTGTASPYTIKSLNLAPPEIIETDTVSISDSSFIVAEPPLNSNITLLEDIDIWERPQRLNEIDTLTLSDIIDIAKTYSRSEEDNLILSDEVETRIPIEFLHNTISFVIQIIKNINNKFSMLKSSFIKCTNKILFRNQGIYSCKNDFRMRGSWQVPANGGVQSLGKEYIKVYIATIEQTDIDIDSISITKGLNNAHTANLILGRAYDATAPDIESVIEIKYSNWTLFKGYITQIIPTDNPENIQLYCEDEMWKQNKTRVYFQVGHLPYGASPDQYYYKYISTALSTLSINGGFGGICPQTINCWGKAKSEAITDLITQSGNFGWFYNENGTPNYWKAGEGSIVNLEAQEIGKNLGIYQVLSHSFKSEVSNIINRLRVQMGVFVKGLNQAYQSYDYEYFAYQPTPVWDSSLEILATPANALGFDYFHHKPENNYLYDNVFKKYKLSNESDLELALSKWTDRYAPRVSISGGGFGWVCSRKEGEQIDGFSIDYKKNGSITFNEPVYYKHLNEYGETDAVRRAQVYVCLYKKKLHTTTNTPNPYPMWFYTGVMGSYPITNTGDLSLSGLSIQSGGRYKDENGDYKYIPSWNDTAFASDVANWELSKNCDEKITGNITLTLDAVCFYNIDLSKRILIPGVQYSPLNIISMSYNLSDFTVTIQLENARSYYRSASIRSRGEDYF